MNQANKYKQLVVYIEACESGSMFDSILPKNMSIYATTASNPDESSWGTYCPPYDMVNGTEIGSCLGDLYSVNFLENLESVDPTKETLLKQFNVVKKETNLSHVMQYGDISIDKEIIGNFEGNSTSFEPLVSVVAEEEDQAAKMSVMNSRFIKLAYLRGRNEKYHTEETKQALFDEVDSIQRFDTIFTSLSKAFSLKVNAGVKDIDFACLKPRVQMYEELCGGFSDYGLRYVKYIYLTCAQNVDIYDYETALFSLCAF